MDAHTRFLILFQGRSGCTLLATSLASHPQIVVAIEPLYLQPRDRQRQWIADHFKAARPESVRAVGFSTKLRDVVEPADLTQAIEDLDLRVIHLSRRNLVKQAFSRLNARRLFAAHGTWNLPKDVPPLPPSEASADEFDQSLHHFLSLRQALDQYVASLGRPVLKLHYEDLLSDRQTVFDRVLSYLGVPSLPLSTTIKKNTDDNLRQVVLNYDAIKQRYDDTEFAAFFD